MIADMKHQLEQYFAWLKDKTVLRRLDSEWSEITTPYLDRHNDYIQIYGRELEGGFLLTDDGYTLKDLEQCGCKLDSPKRQGLLRTTLNGFGVLLKNDELQVHADAENFGPRKHRLVQAILAVNDMFYLAVPMVAGLFHEDVVNWLEQHEIRYTPNVKFSGKSGYDHVLDFVIPKSRLRPERILKAINRPNRDTAQAFLQSWIDTKEVRPSESKAYAVLNDLDHEIPVAVLDAFLNYDVQPIPWSRREQSREELAA